MSFARELEKPRTGRIYDFFPKTEDGLKEGINFDMNKEVGEKEWEGMKDALESFGERKKFHEFATLAERMFEIDPERFRGSSLAKYWSHAQSWLRDQDLGGAPLIHVVSAMKVCAKIDPASIENLGDIWNRYVHLAWVDLSRGECEMVLKYKKNLSIVDQGRAGNVLVLDESYHLPALERYATLDSKKRLIMANNLRLILPEALHLIDLEKEWSGWQDLLHREKKNRSDWKEFAEIASAMNVLAAKEAHITDQGLEIVPATKMVHKEITPPRPKRLTF